MDYRPVAADGDLRGLAPDVQRGQHSLVRVGHGPGETLLLPVLIELFDALVRVRADDVERDLVTVVRTDLVIQAPQLGAAGRSIGGVEVEEHRLALFCESCGRDLGAVEQAHAELGSAQAHLIADFYRLGCRLTFHGRGGLRRACADVLPASCSVEADPQPRTRAAVTPSASRRRVETLVVMSSPTQAAMSHRVYGEHTPKVFQAQIGLLAAQSNRDSLADFDAGNSKTTRDPQLGMVEPWCVITCTGPLRFYQLGIAEQEKIWCVIIW